MHALPTPDLPSVAAPTTRPPPILLPGTMPPNPAAAVTSRLRPRPARRGFSGLRAPRPPTLATTATRESAPRARLQPHPHHSRVESRPIDDRRDGSARAPLPTAPE